MTAQWFDQVPEKGYVIAMFSGMMLFEPYSIQDPSVVHLMERMEKGLIQEGYFFDQETCVHVISRKSRNDVVAAVFTAAQEKQMDPDLVYTQEVLVKPEYVRAGNVPQKLQIINRYMYSEYDTLTLRNFRISWQD